MGASNLQQVVNYASPSNFTFDPTLIEVTGGAAKLKLLVAEIVKNQDFASSSGFTYDSALAEFSAGTLQQKDQTPANSVMAAKFLTDANPITTQANLNWRKDGGSLSATLNGAPTIVGSELVCNGAQGVYWTKNTATQETIRCLVRTPFSGGPATNINIFSIYNGSNNNDRFDLTYSPSGNNLRVTLYNSTGGVVIAAATTIGGTISAVLNQQYEMAVVLDSVAGTVRVFVDGTLHGTLSPGAWTRDTSSSRYYVGASPDVYNTAETNFKDYVAYDAALWAATYTPGYSLPNYIYLTSSATLPAFTHALLGTFLAYTNFATVQAGSPRFTIKSGAGAFKYWDGMGWVASNGDYTQAADKATILANLEALVDVDGQTSSTVKVHFPDSNTISSISDLDLTIESETVYSTANPSIIVNSGVLADALEEFLQTVAVVTGSDALRYTLNINGAEKWWDGSTWSTASGYAQTNSSEEIAVNAAALDISAGVTLKIRAWLHSEDSLSTPELGSITIGYNFYNNQTEPSTCTVWGFYRDISGQPVAGATVAFTLKRSTGQYREAADSIIEKPKSVVTDAAGRFEIDLIWSSEFEAGGAYLLEITKAADSLETKYISGSTRIEFTVPDLLNANITDRIAAI